MGVEEGRVVFRFWKCCIDCVGVVEEYSKGGDCRINVGSCMIV